MRITQNLPANVALEIMESMVGGGMSEGEITETLRTWEEKGYAPEEVCGAYVCLRRRLNRFVHPKKYLVTVCGTGGDGQSIINIATPVTVLAAAAGLALLKHGGRGITSPSGAVDVMKALGIRTELSPAAAALCLKKTGVAFLNMADYLDLGIAGRVRTEVGGISIFSALMPLLNPATPACSFLGIVRGLRNVLMQAWRTILEEEERSGIFVMGLCGMDKASLDSGTLIQKVSPGKQTSSDVISLNTLRRLGITPVPNEALRIRDAEESAQTILAIFQGKERGPKRDVIALNAAVLLTNTTTRTLPMALHDVNELIDEGVAYEKLMEVVGLTRDLAH